MHILASAFRGFAHGIRYSIRLANAHRDRSSFIADHNRHTELKAASTLNHFGNAGNLDHALFKLVLPFKILLLSIFEFCHLFLQLSLELQATFTCAICKRLDASNVAITTTIKYNRLNALSFGAFGKGLTH